MEGNVLTVVAIKMRGKEIVGFTFVDNNYIISEMSYDETKNNMASRRVNVINLTLDNSGEIKGSNGVLDRYTHYDAESGNIIGKPSAIVLNRVERDCNLIGYTVFMPNGKIKKVSVSSAVELHNKGLVANSKIRHTSNKDILSSINGEYPIMSVDIDKADAGTVKMEAVYIADTVHRGSVGLEYIGLYVHGTSASKISKVMNILEQKNDIVRGFLGAFDKSLADSTNIIRGGVTKFFIIVPTTALELTEHLCSVDVDINSGKTLVTRNISLGEQKGMKTITYKGGKVSKDDDITNEELDFFLKKVEALKQKYN